MQTIDYNNYQDLIHSVAWDWSKKINMDQEELFAEGNLLFCSIRGKYDKEKGSFSTFLVECLNNRFGILVRKKKEILFDGESFPEEVTTNTPEGAAEFWSEIKTLSRPAQEMVDIVLNSPAKLADMGEIKDYLREAGWAWRTITNSIKEIKVMFN